MLRWLLSGYSRMDDEIQEKERISGDRTSKRK
jgi:hypothetical protein